MSYEERVTTRTEDTETPGAPAATTTGRAASVTEQRVTRRASGNETARRLVVFLFGLIQGLIVVRILLLLLDAREANDLVAFLLTLSEIFVGPFEGILRTGALTARGSILDLSAIVALVGWTILELIVLGLLGVFRREPDVA
jgi:uncharacterized protein YggT (Ycf19 family)